MSHLQSRNVIALLGPTASGKTRLAIALARRLPLTIISVDSAMVYRGLDIGTAKPAADVLQRYPHALVNIRDPAVSYSAASFLADADAVVARTLDQGRIPLLVGGSMLYFHAFNRGLAKLPDASPEIRAALAAEAAQKGWPALYPELQRVDPLAAAKIHPNNSHRLQRALEVYRATGRPISWWWRQQKVVSPERRHRCRYWQFSLVGLSRQQLHHRIESRFLHMLQQGFIDEVVTLRARADLSLELPAMRAVGYRQMWQYLAGEINRDSMQNQAIVATRQLAKRQLTWLKGWPGLNELNGPESDVMAAMLKILVQIPIVRNCTEDT